MQALLDLNWADCWERWLWRCVWRGETTMGKGARLRRERIENRDTTLELMTRHDLRTAMNREINKQLGAATERFFRDETAVILWVLHQRFGFGAGRLRQFYDCYNQEWEKLKNHYEMSDSDLPYLAKQQLKKIGVNLDEWGKEN